MLIHQGNQTFESSSLVFSEQVLHFDTKKATLNSATWKVSRIQGGELIDLSYLLKKIDKITSEQKFKEINLILREDIEGMSIEITPDLKGRLKHVNIFLGLDLLSAVDEKEVIIFACHEIGHLLDAKSLINNQKFSFAFSKFIKFTGLILLSSLYYFFLRNESSSLLLSLYFLTACVVYFGVMELIKRIIFLYGQRRAEYEADAYAVKLFGDLDAVIRAFQTLRELEEIPENGNLFSTHPSINQRINALKRRFWIKILKKTIFG